MARWCLLAHRGASHAHPENTLRAFAAGFEEGADGLELDVFVTADEVPVVFHDRDLSRLTGAPGDLEALTWAELSERRVGGEPIPRLDEVLGLVTARAAGGHPVVLNVELKSTPRVDALLGAVAPLLEAVARQPGVELVVSTFDPRILLAVLARGVAGRAALLYEDLTALVALRYLPPDAVVDLHPCHELVTAAHLAEYASPKRLFRAWTVDDPDEARRLLALGVTTLITNGPRDLRLSLGAPLGRP